MNKMLLPKIGKFLLKAGIGTLKFSAKVALYTLEQSGKSKDDFRKRQRDYDDYVRAVTHKGPFN